jgi:hypothetical protein
VWPGGVGAGRAKVSGLHCIVSSQYTLLSCRKDAFVSRTQVVAGKRAADACCIL